MERDIEQIMWWRIGGRHYVELDNGRILISNDGILWGEKGIAGLKTAEDQKTEKIYTREIKTLLIAYQELNPKYLSVVKTPLFRIYAFLKK